MDRIEELIMVSQSIATNMQVEQAVFASTDRGNVQGYQLIAKSAGVGSEVALELTRWSPTQLPSDSSERGTISSFRLPDGTVVIARTVYGGPEYSNRGGIQVVTLFLLLRKDQMQGYSHDPTAVVRTALALGHLRLPLDMRRDRLLQVQIPTQPLFRSETQRQTTSDRRSSGALIDEIVALIRASERVAIVGLSDPMDAVESLISKLSVTQREKFSFTTGLSPSIRRPLQAHFYHYPDAVRRRTLQTQDVICLNAVQPTL
jgi:hypothetical protein